MFEENTPDMSLLFIVVSILYIFSSITVGIIGHLKSQPFRIGFVWSIVFTPIIGLFLIVKSKKTANKI
jgi:hypothetical protein